jgi:hypothetical protein
MPVKAAARRTHDYVRHGTTTLFAALEIATGKITADACYPRHRHQEFLRFLKKVAAAHPRADLHVVLDNYGTHKHPEVRKWLARPENKRITLHFTPTGCSWLNMVSRSSSASSPARPSAAAPSAPSPNSPLLSAPSPTPATTAAILLDQGRRRITHQNQTVKELTPRDTRKHGQPCGAAVLEAADWLGGCPADGAAVVALRQIRATHTFEMPGWPVRSGRCCQRDSLPELTSQDCLVASHVRGYSVANTSAARRG